MIEQQSFFTNLIQKGGIFGILTLFLSLIGFLLSILSILNSMKINQQKLPIALKLLILCAISCLFTGAYGTVAGYIHTFAVLGTSTGAAKVSLMEHGNQTARIPLQLGIISFLMQFLIGLVSLFIINSRAGELKIPELSIINIMKKIQVLCFPILITLFPVITGIIFSFWSIEKILAVKPDEPLPALLKISFDFILPAGIIFSYIGIILLVVLFIILLYKKIQGRYAEFPEEEV